MTIDTESQRSSRDWEVDRLGTRNSSNLTIACETRTLDFEMLHYIRITARFVNGILDIVHQN